MCLSLSSGAEKAFHFLVLRVYGKKMYLNYTFYINLHLKVKVKIPRGKHFSNKINKLNVFINILNYLDIYL